MGSPPALAMVAPAPTTRQDTARDQDSANRESLAARLARAWYQPPRENLRGEEDGVATRPQLGGGMDSPLNTPHSNTNTPLLSGREDDSDDLQRTRRQMRDFHVIAPFLEGVASWYGPKFHGKPTASGETYNQYGISAAHPNLPLGTLIEVENRANGRKLRMRVNDRGPYAKGRVLDLSRGAAERLDVLQKGTAPVRITVLQWPNDMASGQGLRPYTQYVVQIASYPDFERAHALRKNMAERAPWATLRLDRSTPTHLAVVAGPYDTHAEASRVAQRLRALGRRDVMVRRFRK